ncbi:uncharacterized protein CIMG_11631 [Coccidioides immitis RS]|uniref:Uncharacterized protein n=1 Tax=Coccidioides immitis (strain RS) TaxID=246410 RepID=A0A0D8JTL4_COCIM|nr:uncharacterized protein CIMG_11631 [Coccidioides immitis RS]KJF60484.1 hypothetical protein CIMG_11631 [Coccidioides immitis RS]
MGHATAGAQIFSGNSWIRRLHSADPFGLEDKFGLRCAGSVGQVNRDCRKGIEGQLQLSSFDARLSDFIHILIVFDHSSGVPAQTGNIYISLKRSLRQGSWAKMLAFLLSMKPEVKSTSPTSISEWNPLLHSSTPIDIGMKNQSRTYHKVEYHIFHRTSSCRSLSPLPQKINWPKRKFSYANHIFILRSNLTIDRTYPELTKSLALPSSLFRSLD